MPPLRIWSWDRFLSMIPQLGVSSAESDAFARASQTEFRALLRDTKPGVPDDSAGCGVVLQSGIGVIQMDEANTFSYAGWKPTESVQ